MDNAAPFTTPPPGWQQKVAIRPIEPRDLPALEWEGEFRHYRNVYANAYQRMVNGFSLIYIAELQGVGIIGQLFVQLVCDRPELADGQRRAYFYAFRVRPAYRSSGLGSRMLATVENELRYRGFQYLTLNVAKDNTRAQELYQRLGYVVVAHEPGIWSYIDDQGQRRSVEEPAWRMVKKIA